MSLVGLLPTFAISCGFAAMLNVMSVDAAKCSAKLMGPSDRLSELIALPLEVSACA